MYERPRRWQPQAPCHSLSRCRPPSPAPKARLSFQVGESKQIPPDARGELRTPPARLLLLLTKFLAVCPRDAHVPHAATAKEISMNILKVKRCP